jgi:hypothetical protein
MINYKFWVGLTTMFLKEICGVPTQLWRTGTNSLSNYLGRVFYSTFGHMYLPKNSKG